MSKSSPAVARVAAAVRASGIDSGIVERPGAARTAKLAADFLGCEVGQIANSLVFRAGRSNTPILVMSSGARRVDTAKLEAIVGEPIAKADADFVRAATGYPIGGVAPVGHPVAVTLLLDADLRRCARVWAAGGTPHTVFAIAPEDLQRATSAAWSDIRA